MNVSAPPSTVLPISPASHPPAGAAPDSNLSAPGLRRATPSSATRPRPPASATRDPAAAPGSTAFVPPVPEPASDFSADAFSAVLESLSKPAPPAEVGQKQASRSLKELSSTPVPPALPDAPAAETAIQSTVVIRAAGPPSPSGIEVSIFGPRLPDVSQEPAPVGSQHILPASPTPAFPAPTSPARPDAPATFRMSTAPPLPAPLLPPSTLHPGPPTLAAEKQARVSLPAGDAAPPATSITGLLATTALAAEAPPAEAVNRPPELPNPIPPPLTPSGANQGIRPLPKPDFLAFAARLVEQPAREAGPEEIHAPTLPVPSAANQPIRPLATPNSVAFAARWVDEPASDPGPGAIRTYALASPTGTDRLVEPKTLAPVTLPVETPDAADSARPPVSRDAAPLSPQQTAGPEHPDLAVKPPAGVRTPTQQREDADNLSVPPRVVRRDSPLLNPATVGAPPAPAGDTAPHTAGFETPQTPARGAQVASVEPGKADTVAQILSGGDPREPAAPGSAHNISVRLSTDQNPAIEVRVMERGGEVRVAVHSPDSATSESLRAGLPDLVARLGQRGFETEIWRGPAAPQPSSSSAQRDPGGAFGRGGHEQPGGDPQRRHPQRENQPAWWEEFEASFTPEGTGA